MSRTSTHILTRSLFGGAERVVVRHPEEVPEAPALILETLVSLGQGDQSVPTPRTRDRDGNLEPRLAGGLGDVDEDAVLDGLGAGVGGEMLHATSLHICCGQGYVAERSHRTAHAQNLQSDRNIIFCSQSESRKAISPLSSFQGRSGASPAASHSAIALAFISRSIWA